MITKKYDNSYRSSIQQTPVEGIAVYQALCQILYGEGFKASWNFTVLRSTVFGAEKIENEVGGDQFRFGLLHCHFISIFVECFSTEMNRTFLRTQLEQQCPQPFWASSVHFLRISPNFFKFMKLAGVQCFLHSSLPSKLSFSSIFGECSNLVLEQRIVQSTELCHDPWILVLVLPLHYL